MAEMATLARNDLELGESFVPAKPERAPSVFHRPTPMQETCPRAQPLDVPASVA